MVSWGPWNYRRNLNTVFCGEFTLVDVQKIWSTPHFHNRWIFGILYHQVDIFTIFCDILTIDFSVSLNNTTDPKTEKYTITQVDSKHKTFLTRDCMKGWFMTFNVTILKKKQFFVLFQSAALRLRSRVLSTDSLEGSERLRKRVWSPNYLERSEKLRERSVRLRKRVLIHQFLRAKLEVKNETPGQIPWAKRKT